MAYSRHLSPGKDEWSAHESALHDLGSPRRLNRQYRARLLTQLEQDCIDGVMSFEASWIQTRQGRIIFRGVLLAILMVNLVEMVPIGVWLLFLVAVALYCFASVRLQEFLAKSGRTAWALRLQPILAVLDFSGLYVSAYGRLHAEEGLVLRDYPDLLFLAFLTAICLYVSMVNERAIRKTKLRRAL